MTAPSDRTALEEAIRAMEDWWQTGLMPTSELTRFTNADCRRIQLVCDAAAAHVETMPLKLLPCPFCGGSPQPRHERGRGEMHWAITCVSDDIDCAVGPETQWYETEADATAAWNRRPHPEPST